MRTFENMQLANAPLQFQLREPAATQWRSRSRGGGSYAQEARSAVSRSRRRRIRCRHNNWVGRREQSNFLMPAKSPMMGAPRFRLSAATTNIFPSQYNVADKKRYQAGRVNTNPPSPPCPSVCAEPASHKSWRKKRRSIFSVSISRFASVRHNPQALSTCHARSARTRQRDDETSE
jgi:hypothetical protein